MFFSLNSLISRLVSVCVCVSLLKPFHSHKKKTAVRRTSELKRIWHTLQEMMGLLVFITAGPKVWFSTAFWTGSICWGDGDRV